MKNTDAVLYIMGALAIFMVLILLLQMFKIIP